MCEVSRQNFSAVFPKLQASLAAANVVALDFEFSGIDLEQKSLFDGPQARYEKARSSARRTTVLQCGLALFTAAPDSPRPNSYSVEVYNFMLFPPAYPPLRCSFVCQSSALEFLRSHNFDLTGCVERGVSFLNDDEIARVKRHLVGLERCDFLRSDTERLIRARAKDVADWLGGQRASPVIKPVRGLHASLLQLELRFRFPDIWTSETAEGEITVFRVTPEERAKRDAEERSLARGSTKEAFLLDLMGFTRIVRTIVNLKKPVVAHNAFMDVLMLFEKFLRPLPRHLAAFKAELLDLLPDLYDTRCIIADIKRCQPDLRTVLGDASVLEDIFVCLRDEATANHDLSASLPPHFIFAPECSHYASSSHSHEAGYDAMMAGFVLLLLGHRAAFPPVEKRALLRPGEVNFEAYRRVLEPFSCRLNVIEARFDWLNLKGEDYGRSKPPRLVITAADGKVDSEALKALADSFGRNDVRSEGNAVHVQFNSFGGFWAMRRELRADNNLSAEPFSALRHQAAVRRSLLVGALVATGASAAAVVSLLVESAVMTAVTVVKPM